MTDSQPGNSGVKQQYAAQVAADLERNAKEQEQIGTEVEALQAQLRALQEDQAILVNMQQALGTKESASAPAKGSTSAPTKPQRKSAAASGAKNSAPKRKTARGAKSVPAPRQSDKGTASTQPTLVTLVQEFLKQQTEPRSAAELTDALAAAHPDRTFKKPVVRTTVEGQVAKGLAQRSKQGSSVFYSSPEQAQSPEPAPEQ
ncbi:hypothetical protein OKJ48_19820 [Streptomyces kunmingensis]|uniref:Regulatory protein n=1 Tax=Streptomyces kunmingensis TaxID=68225 RepID=A0ABU6CCN7_9ACTN|nr:hypothetical protein [Streptomyces kunmingensis]MEB3962483.1 hypothetical protein [Streptomyces kunmingensis]